MAGVLLDDVAAYLVAQSTKFTLFSGTSGNLGKSISLDVDGVPDTFTAIYEPSGLPAEHAMSTGSATRLMMRPNIQVLCRSTSYQTARANAQTAHDLLDGLAGGTLNSNRYTSIDAVSAPFTIGRDEHDRHLVSCNYNLRQDV